MSILSVRSEKECLVNAVHIHKLFAGVSVKLKTHEISVQ